MQTVGDIWDSEELTPVQTRATLALLSAAISRPLLSTHSHGAIWAFT